jgi:hypothetical protein
MGRFQYTDYLESYASGNIILHRSKARVDPKVIVWLGGLAKLKKSTSSGLNPMTFQLVE